MLDLSVPRTAASQMKFLSEAPRDVITYHDFFKKVDDLATILGLDEMKPVVRLSIRYFTQEHYDSLRSSDKEDHYDVRRKFRIPRLIESFNDPIDTKIMEACHDHAHRHIFKGENARALKEPEKVEIYNSCALAFTFLGKIVPPPPAPAPMSVHRFE